MPGVSGFFLFLMAAALLAIAPGPGNFYVASRTLAGGRAEGLASSFGTGLGGMVHVVAGAAGISAIVLASAQLFAALKLVGAVYLVWLGVRTLIAARRESLSIAPAVAAVGPGRAFREGVLVEALNPKTAAFFLAFVPQFVEPGSGHVAIAFAVLGLISVALNTLADMGVALAASAVRARAAGSPLVVRRLRQASGAMMVALGLGLLVAERPAR